jgi:hypothetical protein
MEFIMKFITILSAFCILITSPLMGGTMSVDATSSFQVGQWVLDGTFNIEGNGVRVGILSGTGLIKGNKFALRCREFNFRGTIECDGECIIICQNPFDYSSLTLKGKGSITVIISPHAYDFRPYTKSDLCAEAKNAVISDLLDKTDEDLEKQINLIRTYSALSKLDENQIFNAVMEMLDQKIEYRTEHQNDIFDPIAENKKIFKDRLKFASKAGAVTVAGLLPIILFCTTNIKKNLKMSNDAAFYIGFPGSVISLIGAFITVGTLIESYPKHVDPQHKERLSKLYAIKKKVEQALATPYILEKELVIKLQ